MLGDGVSVPCVSFRRHRHGQGYPCRWLSLSLLLALMVLLVLVSLLDLLVVPVRILGSLLC